MIIEKIAEIKIRLDRGNSLIYWLRNIIIIVAGIKYLFSLSLFWTILAGLITIIGVYILGLIDLDYVKLFQKEAELSTGKYNPFFVEKLGKKVGA